jgi:HSP20 family protein
MANVSVYDPFGPGFNRLFANLIRPFPEDRSAIEIKVDVTEDTDKYMVKADIPGVAKEDIKVDIDGNHVSISAEVKKQKEEKKGETVVYSERYEGKAFRGFTLDREVDEAKSVAKYADGVLELTLPKKANGSAKRIAVS